MKRTIALLAASTVAALIIFVQTMNDSRSAPVAPPVASGLAKAADLNPAALQPELNPSAADFILAPRFPMTATLTQVAPAQVRAVFPSIANRVAHWRDFNPETLTIAPFPDMPLTFTRVAAKEDSSLTGGQYTTWLGRSAEMPGASLVTVGTDEGFHAILNVPGSGEMYFHVAGAGDNASDVRRGDISSSDVGCGVGSVKPTPYPTAHTAAILAANYQSAADAIPMPTSTMALAASTAPAADVLFIYDATMLALAQKSTSGDPAAYLDGQYKAVVESMNLFVAQSHITSFQWRYTGILAAPAYTRTEKLGDDLNAMKSATGLGAWVSTVSNQYSVDEVVLVVGTSADYGGIAGLNPGGLSTNCVVAGNSGDTVGLAFISAEVCAHELGHTLGCNHDRITANVQNDGHNWYGWVVTAPGTSILNGVPMTRKVGSIMAYAEGRVPYFSNPDISLHIYEELIAPQASSQPIGSWTNPDYGTFTIGVPDTDPNAQNNAKVIEGNGAKLVAFRESLAMPVITKQPNSTVAGTDTAGFSLSVTATGGGLQYQWMKGGAAITGATSTTFSKYTASTDDAGTYSVEVKNMVGSVTSTSSSVTVSIAPVTPPPSTNTGGGSTSSGGGGGGGGSIGMWFVGALGALLALRRKFRSA